MDRWLPKEKLQGVRPWVHFGNTRLNELPEVSGGMTATPWAKTNRYVVRRCSQQKPMALGVSQDLRNGGRKGSTADIVDMGLGREFSPQACSADPTFARGAPHKVMWLKHLIWPADCSSSLWQFAKELCARWPQRKHPGAGPEQGHRLFKGRVISSGLISRDGHRYSSRLCL